MRVISWCAGPALVAACLGGNAWGQERARPVEDPPTARPAIPTARPAIPTARPAVPTARPATPPAATVVKPAEPFKPAAPRLDLPPERKQKPPVKIDASWQTRTEARTITLTVPAPRGQITDRNGLPLVQNRVARYLALKLPYLENATDSAVLAYARERIRRSNYLLDQNWSLTDKAILEHYEHRRWLPLKFSAMLTQGQIDRMKPQLGTGLALFPEYVRYYPLGKTAAHILGYVGTEQKIPTGAISSGQPLFGITKGRDGIELIYDEYLTGTNGKINFLFDADGTKLAEELIKQPAQGSNVITTLDLGMQLTAERVLREAGRKGAFVVLNVKTGDVLAMASWPSYDLNDWIPFMRTERYKQLQEDPSLPLIARAFRGAYPPASTFKVPVALAALEGDFVTEDTIHPCPYSIYVGDRYFHNWNKKGEGPMNVMQALMRSCNTWFYKVGLQMGGETISAMAHQLGMGQPTGLPLEGELAGYVPTTASLKERHRDTLGGGNLANMSIGQGYVLSTPIQVARMMAAVANGYNVPRTRLVLQVQDMLNNVVKSYPPESHTTLALNPYNLDVVRRGLTAVVNSPSGTGKSARNEYVTVAGKTGTGQWNPAKKLYVAWFAGYLPVENPEYAFAVIVEGRPGETVGGGKNAAPLVGEFFNELYEKKHENGELDGFIKAEIAVVPSPGYSGGGAAGGNAGAAANGGNTQPISSGPKKKRGFFDRLGLRRRR